MTLTLMEAFIIVVVSGLVGMYIGIGLEKMK